MACHLLVAFISAITIPNTTYIMIFQIGLVAFNNDVAVPTEDEDSGTDCYRTQLARAVPQNIEHLKSFVLRFADHHSLFFNFS